MKGRNPDGSSAWPYQAVDSPPHLLRRFVGEGYSQYATRIHLPETDQEGDTVGKNARLPTPRSCQDKQGTIKIENRLPLFWIEVLKKLLFNYQGNVLPTK